MSDETNISVLLLPHVGDIWHWEPLKPHVSVEVVVTDVRWNGEEWWIVSRPTAGGPEYCNTLSRWIEATVLVHPTSPRTGGRMNGSVTTYQSVASAANTFPCDFCDKKTVGWTQIRRRNCSLGGLDAGDVTYMACEDHITLGRPVYPTDRSGP